VWKSHATVLVSDGGKPFELAPSPGTSIVPRLLRVQDVIGNQAHALRTRYKDKKRYAAATSSSVR
jgi:NTE family protein